MSIRHNGDGSNSMTPAQARARRLYDIGQQDEECDFRTAQIPSDFTATAPPFQVTTECSDSEGDDSDHRRASRNRSLQRLIGIPFDSDTSEEERFAAPIEPLWSPSTSSPQANPPSRLRRRETTSNITPSSTHNYIPPQPPSFHTSTLSLAAAAEASQAATQEAVRAVGGELQAPHAKFFIERDKSKCTIRFDPPVSGRFILLKLWSPHHASPTGNIDIQSVVARGYAGPRFFPAVTMR